MVRENRRMVFNFCHESGCFWVQFFSRYSGANLASLLCSDSRATLREKYQPSALTMFQVLRGSRVVLKLVNGYYLGENVWFIETLQTRLLGEKYRESDILGVKNSPCKVPARLHAFSFKKVCSFVFSALVELIDGLDACVYILREYLSIFFAFIARRGKFIFIQFAMYKIHNGFNWSK